MRLTTVILIASLMQVSAAGLAQKITLSKSKVPLKDVLKDIRKQSGYIFLYNEGEIKNSRPVSIQSANADFFDVLNQIFSDQPLTYKINKKTIVIMRKEPFFPDIITDGFSFVDIQGVVLDEKGNKLIGATVKVKGTKNATVTNANGGFTLKGVKEKDILEVSYLGYKTRELEASGNFITVQLESSPETLNQVMVTGYQTISRERATGAFTTIGSDELSKRPVSNLANALEGMVAGMQGSSSFLIRGSSSLYADRSPLVVVDGFPITGSNFSDINPNDVASVTVLKDAAAASIWGARSANGVIVITTKRLKANSKLQIGASAFTRISNRIDLDDALVQANSADQVAYERLGFNNNWAFRQFAGSFNDVRTPLTLAQELLFANNRNAGSLSEAEMNAGLNRLSQINNRQQIQDLLLQNAMLNQFNLNLQAGTDRSKTYGSMMFEKNKDASKKNGYDRLNLNFNNDFKVNRLLNLTFGANVQYKKTESGGASLSEIKGLSPYELLLNPDGSYATNLKGFNRAQLALMPTNLFPYSDWSYNLLQEVRGRSFSNENFSARLQSGLNLQIMKGLTFDSKLQYEKVKGESNNYYDESTFYVRSLVNTYTNYNNTTKVVGKSYIPKGGILDQTGSGGTLDLNTFLLRNQLNFDRNFGLKHAVSIIAGTEMSRSTSTTRINPTVYGYLPEKLQTIAPQLGYGYDRSITDFEGFIATVPGGNTTFSWRRDKYISFYTNASYTYDNKYTITGSARSDASNFITSDAGLRWSPLWSVGAKWNLKGEKFMDNIEAIDRLAVRLTYGKNGNVEKSTSTEALVNVRTSPEFNTQRITATISSNGNPYLTWEKTSTTNLGIDFSLFKNRISGSIELYNKNGKGIIGNIALPSYTGTSLQRFNNAGISNKGFEVTLGANLEIPHTGIHYNTSVAYAYNYNKITSLYNPNITVSQFIGGEFIEGRPVNSLYSYTYMGMKDGVPQVQGPDGTLQSFNNSSLSSTGIGGSFLNYEGTQTPPHTLGWVNNFQFKGFDLNVIFNGKFGGVYRNPTFAYGNTFVGFGKTFVSSFVKDIFAGDPNIPGFSPANNSLLINWDSYAPYLNTLVESSSYIECKEITLGYALPSKLAKAIELSSIRVFAQTRDLGLVWAANSKGYNPDWLPGSSRPQTFMFGINLQF